MRQRGENRPKLIRRGKRRGERLEARIKAWRAGQKETSNSEAWHKPGSEKK